MKKPALVLEGGGMRGLYTAGVLDSFLDDDIGFDDIYAVSAGSCHAMSYKSKQRGRAYRSCVEHIDNWRYCSVRSLLLTGDLFGAKYCYDDLPNKLDLFDYDTYRKNPTRVYAVCSNLETGEAEYIPVPDGKSDIIYVRASSSLPLVSRIVKTGHGPLLDGGICDSIPIKKALSEHERAVVILTQPKGYVKKPSGSMGLIRKLYAKYPKFIEAAERRHENYNESLEIIEQAEKDGRVLCIRPAEPCGFGRIEKDKAKLEALYRRGLADGKAPEIAAFLR